MANERLISITINLLNNSQVQVIDTPVNKEASLVLASLQSGAGAYITNALGGRLWIPTTAVATIQIIVMNDDSDDPTVV